MTPQDGSLLPLLVVEDDAALREALGDTLRLAGYDVIEAADGEAALAAIGRQRVGMVVSDVQMKPMDGHALLLAIKARAPEIPVLLMTAYGMIDSAVAAMRDGACNYITKPFEPDVLIAQVVRHMLPAAYADEAEMIAEDPVSRELVNLARRVAATDATVLITGESGTGKEVLARLLHRASPRAGKPFVAVNCAAIPDNLLESTLFGYERGAFTGAQTSTPGKFELAHEGTLLLDEISEMPLALQAKLLRVLQEREVERVGGRKPVPVDIRVIATSNRDMVAERQSGRFREDLFYRLNVFPLHNPPLRERPGDILPIARRILARGIGGRKVKGFELSEAAGRSLTTYGWPGNIRELENVMQRAMILAPGRVIDTVHLALPSSPLPPLVPSAPPPATEATPLDMRSLERTHILAALEAAGGVRRVAAERLRMSERTLRHKLQQYRREGHAIPAGGARDETE